MSIEIILTRENETDFTVYFEIDIDKKTYQFHADIPKGINQQKWLESRQDFIRFLILGKMYPNADWQAYQKEDMSEYQSIKAWIKAGCKNPDGTVIEEKPWKSTHPSYIEIENEIESISNIPAKLKKVLKKMAKRLR